MDYNIVVRDKVKDILASMVESGSAMDSARQTLDLIYEIVPKSRELSPEDWKDIELYYRDLLIRQVLKDRGDV